MSPQPFEQWLFERDRLTPQQQEQLQSELAGNPELSRLAAAWEAVEAKLRAAPWASPTAGFSARWRAALARRQECTARRRDWITFGLTMGGALLSLALLGVGAMGPLTTPAELAKAWAMDLIALQRKVELALGLTDALVGSLPLLLQVSLSVTLLLTAGWMSMLWLASIYRYAYLDIRNGG